MADPPVLLACGIFAREVEGLESALRERFEPVFLDSMMHMKPARLDAALRDQIARAAGRPIVALFGDCCPLMQDLFPGAARRRTPGENCIEIALGKERYRELRRRSSFFLMPEWAQRWEEVFDRELGLREPGLAREFMQSAMRELVYIDTGSIPLPKGALALAAERFGLPLRIESPGVARIAEAIRAVLDDRSDD